MKNMILASLSIILLTSGCSIQMPFDTHTASFGGYDYDAAKHHENYQDDTVKPLGNPPPVP